MKELIQQIRKSRLNPEEIVLIDLCSKLEINKRSNYDEYGINDIVYFGYFFYGKTLIYSSYIRDIAPLFSDLDFKYFLTKTIRERNLFPDLEINEIL